MSGRRRAKPDADRDECHCSRDNLNEQAGESNIGGLLGAEIFDLYNLEEIAENVVRRAVNKLDAQACPTGMMPVVIGNEFGGVFFMRLADTVWKPPK